MRFRLYKRDDQADNTAVKRRRIFGFMVLSAAACYAQTDAPNHVFVVQEVEPRPPASRTEEFRTIVSGLQADKLRLLVPGSWEDQVLTGARKAAAASLRVKLADSDLIGDYTLTTDQGDVLIACWRGAERGRAEKAIWLRDAPRSTTFVMEIDPTVLQPHAFVQYIEGLFQWDTFIKLKSIKLTYLAPERGEQWVVATAIDHEKWQVASPSVGMGMIGESKGSEGYVGVILGKLIFPNAYPPDAVDVPERFPPLRQRLHTTPRPELFIELGKGYDPRMGFSYPTNRDAIVMGELLSRGALSQAELRQVLVGPFDKGDYHSALLLGERATAFFRAAEEHNQVGVYALAIANVFLDVPIHGAGDYPVGRVFGAMERNRIDFSSGAFAFLEHARYVRPSLAYLGRFAHDKATLQRLSAINVAPEFKKEKERALRNIQGRLK